MLTAAKASWSRGQQIAVVSKSLRGMCKCNRCAPVGAARPLVLGPAFWGGRILLGGTIASCGVGVATTLGPIVVIKRERHGHLEATAIPKFHT